MLEYIRSKEIMEALKFAQIYFADAVCKISDKNSKMLTELQKTMTLLAFDNPIDSPNGYLLKKDFTKIVAGNLNTAILKYITGDAYESVEEEQFTSDSIPKLTQMMALMMHFNSQSNCKIDFPEEFYDNKS